MNELETVFGSAGFRPGRWNFPMKLVIGSRGSKLALWQAEWVLSQLCEAGHTAEIKVITTTGDRLTAASLTQAGTKGLFIKEIEEALAAGAIDLAVHSLKDLPVDQPEGLSIAAIPPREDARDALISRAGGAGLAAIPQRACVGTSSLRRQSQLLGLRPDLGIVPLRGNVDTRIRKLERGDCEAIVMAAAGLHRLGLTERISEYFSPDQICPAAGQGALAIEIRRDDERTASAVRPLDHPSARTATCAERAALRRLGGGCRTPIAAYAVVSGASLEIAGMVASPDGTRIIRARAAGGANDPEAVGTMLAEKLLEQGARALLSS